MVNADGRSWTGGFVTQWGKNFTFVTIKHAGHMSAHMNMHTHSKCHWMRSRYLIMSVSVLPLYVCRVPGFEPEAAITFYSAFLKHQLPQ